MRNRIAKEKRLGVAIVAIALTASLLLTACAPRPSTEEKTVQFGEIQPITGAVAAATQFTWLGGQDYVRYFNEQEVIPGVRIESVWGDSARQLALFTSHYERFVAAGTPLIRAEESSWVIAMRKSYARDQVVLFLGGGGSHELAYPEPGWIYAVTPLVCEQTAVVLEHFSTNWKEERPPRCVFAGYDAVWGQEPRYATEYARGLGFEVLPPESIPMAVLDATTELLRWRDTGADLVYLQMIESSAAPILRDAERLGLLDQFQFAGHQSSMGDNILKVAAAGSEGYLIPAVYPWLTDTEVPGVKLMTDNMMKYHGEVLRQPQYYFGWVAAAVVCEAIKRAIENVGYENLDGPAVKEALDGMKGFDVYGLASVTYKADDQRGVTKLAVYEVRGGELVRASDWREVPSARDWEFE
jgi:ABC-type branched-subunit amino acid transport system substrate-binding protein